MTCAVSSLFYGVIRDVSDARHFAEVAEFERPQCGLDREINDTRDPSLCAYFEGLDLETFRGIVREEDLAVL